MLSRPRPALIALALAVATATRLRAGDEIDPCRGQYLGAYLAGNLLDISVTTNALHLLNGREDPKLKRLLEWRLLAAAADARRHIDEGATVDPAATIQGWTAGVEKATIYVAEHDLDEKPPVPVVQGITKPSDDLAAIKKWLSKQSSGLSPSR